MERKAINAEHLEIPKGPHDFFLQLYTWTTAV